MSEEKLTKGEQIVRTQFNPSNNGLVDEVKQGFAKLINLVDANSELDPRLAAIAITQLETAAMFSVKLVTTNITASPSLGGSNVPPNKDEK